MVTSQVPAGRLSVFTRSGATTPIEGIRSRTSDDRQIDITITETIAGNIVNNSTGILSAGATDADTENFRTSVSISYCYGIRARR